MLVALGALSGCSATLAPAVDGSVFHNPSWRAGAAIEIQTHTPARTAEGLAFGLRVEHFVQAHPYVDYDQSRYLAEIGASWIPRGYRRYVGVEFFGLAGIARGSMGAADATPIAGVLGASFGVPIRLTEAAFGDDALLQPTFLLVPYVIMTGAYPIAPSQGQLSFGGGIGVRIHLDSTLLP